MSTIKHPEELWQRDSLVIAVETIELAGEVLPLSVGQITVVNRKITTSTFNQIAWGRYRRKGRPVPTKAELQQALGTVKSLRRLKESDLFDGDRPESVLWLIKNVVRVASKHDSLLVTHSVSPGLVALLKAVENQLGSELPAVSVVSTDILERARRGGHHLAPDESHSDFYQRMQALEGDLPDLVTCWNEQEWNKIPLYPGDRLFPAMATHLIYQHHLGGRLLRVA